MDATITAAQAKLDAAIKQLNYPVSLVDYKESLAKAILACRALEAALKAL